MKEKLLTFLFASLFAVTGCNSNSYPQYVLDSSWGKDKACTMYDTFHALIPYMEANDYEFVYSVDEYGDDMLSAFFYYESDEASERKEARADEPCSEAAVCKQQQEDRNGKQIRQDHSQEQRQLQGLCDRGQWSEQSGQGDGAVKSNE